MPYAQVHPAPAPPLETPLPLRAVARLTCCRLCHGCSALAPGGMACARMARASPCLRTAATELNLCGCSPGVATQPVSSTPGCRPCTALPRAVTHGAEVSSGTARHVPGRTRAPSLSALCRRRPSPDSSTTVVSQPCCSTSPLQRTTVACNVRKDLLRASWILGTVSGRLVAAGSCRHTGVSLLLGVGHTATHPHGDSHGFPGCRWCRGTRSHRAGSLEPRSASTDRTGTGSFRRHKRCGHHTPPPAMSHYGR